jgi:ATP:corrinoid adenosyltransferase
MNALAVRFGLELSNEAAMPVIPPGNLDKLLTNAIGVAIEFWISGSRASCVKKIKQFQQVGETDLLDMMTCIRYLNIQFLGCQSMVAA